LEWRLHTVTGKALIQLNLAGAEAEHERAVRFSSAPDTGLLLLTLRRWSHAVPANGRDRAFFALCFALEQMRRNFCDLNCRGAEMGAIT
jgi:hypothetical protein